MAGLGYGADYRMQNAAMLHAGKVLTDPLLLLLAIAIAAVAMSMRHRAARRSSSIALFALLLLALLSTRVVSRAIERSLRVEAIKSAAAPQFIVVASGGSHAGQPPMLTASSESRLLAAVRWWRQHRQARLVLAGVDELPSGPSRLTLDLMHAAALRMGVPAAAIIVESRSTNTREHALRLLELPGVTRTTPIGIVTSDWHMRRMYGAFRRHFAHVSTPAPQSALQTRGVIDDVLPSSQELRTSTRLLHEWLGVAWYALRR